MRPGLAKLGSPSAAGARGLMLAARCRFWLLFGALSGLAAGLAHAAAPTPLPGPALTEPEPARRAEPDAGSIPQRAATPSSGQPEPRYPVRRKEQLDELRRILPASEPWEAWLRESGELPPDFAQMKHEPFLPDPLRFENGKVATLSSWFLRRRELWALFQHYLFGTMPASPGNVQAIQVQERPEAAALVQQVILAFGPQGAARLHLELVVPEGEGPFPVFLTTFDDRSWGQVAVSRGYIACFYPGGETQDATGAWASIWPDFSWSQLLRRAWAAGRCVDYLHQIPAVDTNRIAIAGHGSTGKVALVAGALDLRIDAVVASSSGAGGACSFRFFSESQFGQGIEPLTRQHPHWFHPRLRFFAGRESRLPVDSPELIACIAPRPCLLSTALYDPEESVWAVEQTVQSARRAYQLFERSRALTLHHRPAGHAIRAGDNETSLDWLDTVFDRGFFPFPDSSLYPTYAVWESLTPEKPDPNTFPTNTPADLLMGPDGQAIQNPAQWTQHRESLRDKLFAVLGTAPPFATAKTRPVKTDRARRDLFPARDLIPSGVGQQSINFGNDIDGDLWFPTGADQARHTFPAAIWLHPVSPATGYVPGWHLGDPPHLALARRGLVVLAYDQIGHGTRLDEVKHFYHRYPGWSLLGRQIDDALAAVDALLQIEWVDPSRIFLVGYDTGGRTALHAAALDTRVAGVVSLAGMAPMRPEEPSQGRTGGPVAWSRWLPLHPQLGPFLGAEKRLPYDYHEVLALIAPRPAVLLVPRLDEESRLEEVQACARRAAQVFEFLGAANRLQVRPLEDYNRLSQQSQRLMVEQLADIARARLPGAAEPK